MSGKPGARVDALERRIRNGERDVSDADRELLLEFLDRLRLLREEYSDYRRLKLLRHVTRIAEHADTTLAAVLTDREAAEDAVRWIHSEYENEETNRDYRVALRVFGRRVTDGDDSPPESLAWVSSKTSRNYQPAPNPGEMLRWEEDIEPMLDNARNPRDTAAIALQMDAGLRGGELFNLTIGDLHDSTHSLKVWAEGKRGERGVDLIPSIPYVNRWLDEHPGGSESDPLWSLLSEPTQLSYQRYLQMFKEPARRAGIEKTVTPTAFRKSNASWLARMGANEALIEDRQGRVRGSEAVSRYVAEFGEEDAESQYAAMHGLDVEIETADQHAPVTCPRCEKKTPSRVDSCMHCQQSLGFEKQAATEQVIQRFEELAVKSSDPDDRVHYLEGARTVRERPNMMDVEDLHQLASSVEDSGESD